MSNRSIRGKVRALSAKYDKLFSKINRHELIQLLYDYYEDYGLYNNLPVDPFWFELFTYSLSESSLKTIIRQIVHLRVAQLKDSHKDILEAYNILESYARKLGADIG